VRVVAIGRTAYFRTRSCGTTSQVLETNSHTWAGLLRRYDVSEGTTTRLIRSLVAAEVASLAFCRLLDRWARGEPEPSTPGRREAALRRAAERAEAALGGLEVPLGRYLLELEPDGAEGRSWYGEPGPGEVLDWRDVLRRAGVSACPNHVAQAYLELAVFVRALQGLTSAAHVGSPPGRAALWAGLFDLRENLYGGAVDDLRALAA
jgi:hypothetical protein